MGPCQYILQTEGLASDSNPTPDNVMTFVEKQFAKKKEAQSADEIRQMLAEMVAHVEQADKRIGQYAELGRDLRAICEGPASSATRSRAAEMCRTDVYGLQAEIQSATPQPAAGARKLADEVLALIGKLDSAAELRRLGLELRRLGASQDRALANSRMAARWLRQQVAMIAEDNPAIAELAAKIERRIGETVGGK